MGRLVSCCALALIAASVPASAGASLPSVDSGARPGPDALYAPPPRAPQLENTGPWKAEPILVSGASAYRDGEFLYQDFLLDDYGAAGAREPDNPMGPDSFLFAPTTGTMTYPTDPVYADNAADLVELRVKPLAGATAFRITLNTLKDADRTGVTIALGGSATALPWPHRAGVRSPAQLFLTVHGTTAELRDAATGAVKTPAPTATVDLARRQIDVRVPHAAWNPGAGKVRMAAGAGLWDTAGDAYLQPSARRSATTPGGAAPTRAALFNVAFRYDEPMPDVDNPAVGWTIADAAAGAAVQATWWREKAQAEALTTGDISAFSTEVDFGKLAAGTDDDARVPKTGSLNRIFASRYSFGQGVDHSKVCFSVGSPAPEPGPKCQGRQIGQLQHYAVYVPKKPRPAKGYGLTLLLHSLSANYNQYTNSKNQSQIGERNGGAIVATPAGRGPDGFYAGVAEADTFEVWADVARHYAIDPDWTTVTGYSMGGFGTYRLLARYPDLFARGASIVATPGAVDDQLASLRNTPVLNWVAAGDELVPIDETEKLARDLAALRLRFIHDLFPQADHLTLATNDEYGPVAEFLGDHRVDRDPPHVTYVVDPNDDSAAADAVADHAYWLSGVRPRDPKAAQRGTIDARSDAFGVGDPKRGDVVEGAGVVTGGARGPQSYRRRSLAWDKEPAQPKADRLVVEAKNLATATVDTRRARLSCSPLLDVKSDGPFDLRLSCPAAGPSGDVAPQRTGRRRGRAGCARTAVVIKLPRVKGRRVVSVVVTRRNRRVRRARGRNLRTIAVRRPTTRAFALRLRVRTSGQRPRTVTVLRRFRAC
jgi:dienelactone hydrolase